MENRFTIFIRKNVFLILGIVVLLSVILRFYKLGSIPEGLYQDETSIGYNAYSILTTGKDEYGKKFPLYFKSFGDQKLPIYIYMTTLSEKAFGLNAFAVRFPSAFFGTLSVIILFFLVFNITKNHSEAILSSFLLTINPWSLQFSRAGFEVNVAMFFAMLGTLLLLYALDKEKSHLLILLLSILSFGLSMYSYNVTRILSPILAVLVIGLFRNKFIRIPTATLAICSFFSFLIGMPFITSLFAAGGAHSASGALITSNDIQARILEFRSYFVNSPSFIISLFFNKWIMTLWIYLENIVKVFNANFFFIQGSEHGNQGIGNVGSFYLFQFPLLIFGIIYLVRNGVGKYVLFVWWLVLSLLILSLSKEVPHATRGYFLVVPLTVFSALGMLYGASLLKKLKKNLLALSLFFVSMIMVFNISYYFASYYVRFPVLYAPSWRQQDKDLVEYLITHDQNYDKIIFDNKSGFIYSSLLFYSTYNPTDFQKGVVRYPDDTEGFSSVKSFGKYVFKDVDWTKDPGIRTLIVTSSNNKPNESRVVKTFYYPTRPVVLSIKEVLAQYPVTDPAYILVEGLK